MRQDTQDLKHHIVFQATTMACSDNSGTTCTYSITASSRTSDLDFDINQAATEAQVVEAVKGVTGLTETSTLFSQIESFGKLGKVALSAEVGPVGKPPLMNASERASRSVERSSANSEKPMHVD